MLDKVDLTIDRGETVVLIGENGTGKTTLSKTILGEIQPDGGVVNLHNETVGYVAQELEISGDIAQAFGRGILEWRIAYALGLVGLGQLDTVDKPDEAKNYKVSITGDVVSSKLVVRAIGVSKSYEREILSGVSFEIRGNERIHLRGANGSSKTTLLKIVAGGKSFADIRRAN